jgi:undecaprenyl diphosphate synthase
MDGNSTWAIKRGKNVMEGYMIGMRNMSKIILKANSLGIKFATFYAFSSENWGRPVKWIADFMDLALKFLKGDGTVKTVLAISPRIIIIGDDSKLRSDIKDILDEYVERTRWNTGIVTCLAISYGGRDEIVRSVRRMIASGASVSEQAISDNLDTGGIPDPELVIRTGGKQRLSNFLLWQSSYSELYFSELSWPEFDETELECAILRFGEVERTYGK